MHILVEEITCFGVNLEHLSGQEINLQQTYNMFNKPVPFKMLFTEKTCS